MGQSPFRVIIYSWKIGCIDDMSPHLSELVTWLNQTLKHNKVR